MIDTTHKQISQRRQCELLSISRSGLYYQAVPISDETLILMNAIDEEYTRHPFRGTRGMTDYLHKQDFEVGRYRVRQLYAKMGIQSVAPGPHTSKPNKKHPKFPYLLDDYPITQAHQVFSTDITYIRLSRGFIYLMAIIDWYSRFVLDWELSITLEGDFCIEAVDRILHPGVCDVFNVDQGAQFTSPLFTKPILDNGIAVSMDGKGRAIDNVFVERLWRSLKYECVYLRQFESVGEARSAIDEYFDFYNHHRGHQSLSYRTPGEVHLASLIKHKKIKAMKTSNLSFMQNFTKYKLTQNQSIEILREIPEGGIINKTLL